MTQRSQTVNDRLAAASSRGLGCANVLAAEALQSPETLSLLVAAIRDERSVVTSRAANALRKVQRVQPELLAAHARALLRAASQCADLQTRWNLLQVIGSLPLRGRDKALAVELLFEALRSESGFLRAFALTGLVTFAQDDNAMLRRVRPLVQRALEDTSAAMRARARKLLKLVEAARPEPSSAARPVAQARSAHAGGHPYRTSGRRDG